MANDALTSVMVLSKLPLPPQSKSILIVEDDPLIALDLAQGFRDEGFTVVGPASTVQDALALVRDVPLDGASLDYELGRETSLPIALSLIANNVPLVFVSGRSESIDTSRFSVEVTTLSKPADAKKIISALFPNRGR